MRPWAMSQAWTPWSELWTWNEGAFEFIPGAEPEARSIDLDLHRAVMQALKLHDELKRGRRKTG